MQQSNWQPLGTAQPLVGRIDGGHATGGLQGQGWKMETASESSILTGLPMVDHCRPSMAPFGVRGDL